MAELRRRCCSIKSCAVNYKALDSFDIHWRLAFSCCTPVSRLRGILGMQVDDGIHGGDEYFLEKIASLEKNLPFGSRKSRAFTFTGIQLEQFPESIKASQGEYVHAIPQIDIGRIRRAQPSAAITEPERTKLRGLIGSLQYAVTHTRPDLAARLGEISDCAHFAGCKQAVEGSPGAEPGLCLLPPHSRV